MITHRSSAQREILLLQFKHDLLEKIYDDDGGTLIHKLGLPEKYGVLKEIVEELEKGKTHYPPPFHLDTSDSYIHGRSLTPFCKPLIPLEEK